MTMAESSTWQQCGLSRGVDFMPKVEMNPTGLVDVKADDAQLVEQGTSVFTGNVIIVKDGQELTAQRVTYNQVSGQITATDRMQMRDSDIILKADQAEWSLNRDEGTLVDAQYQLREMHARGQADHVFRVGVSETD